MNPSILLTIDVEDWFQVENFKQYIPYSSWPSCELRVEKNTHRLLDLLDSIRLQPSAMSYELGCESNPKATFFVLGWIAERLPRLVREIHSRGHEVASHGYRHDICNQEASEELKRDLSDSKKRLEDIIGVPVYGYRAPSFSINNDILKVIQECGYLYDSSYNSFALHSRYGHLDLSRNGQKGIAFQIADPRLQTPEPETRNPKPRTFYELPISNLHFRTPFSYVLSAISSEQNRGGFVLPWGGGGYFRLIPFPLFKIGIKCILGQENAYLFYFHPWEIDPGQPKVNDAPFFYKFRHYINLSKTHIKLLKLIEDFAHCNFMTCSQYLDEVRNCAL